MAAWGCFQTDPSGCGHPMCGVWQSFLIIRDALGSPKPAPPPLPYLHAYIAPHSGISQAPRPSSPLPSPSQTRKSSIKAGTPCKRGRSRAHGCHSHCPMCVFSFHWLFIRAPGEAGGLHLGRHCPDANNSHLPPLPVPCQSLGPGKSCE